jgi:hypothetical protein
MSNIIDYTYFINDLGIPIKSTPALNTAINDSITLYEDEVLKLLLGYKTWKDMKTAYDAAGTLDTKWDKLINGAEFEYTINGITYFDKWVGFQNDSKVSLIANYVYFFHRRNNTSQNTGIGETVPTSENSKVISPYTKLVVAWNKMIDMYGELDKYGIPYPYPSAYNFITANAADYPDWKFVRMDKIISPFRMWS